MKFWHWQSQRCSVPMLMSVVIGTNAFVMAHRGGVRGWQLLTKLFVRHLLHRLLCNLWHWLHVCWYTRLQIDLALRTSVQHVALSGTKCTRVSYGAMDSQSRSSTSIASGRASTTSINNPARLLTVLKLRKLHNQPFEPLQPADSIILTHVWPSSSISMSSMIAVDGLMMSQLIEHDFIPITVNEGPRNKPTP